MEITELIKHHTDTSIADIDKNYTKKEILECLRTSAWTYSSTKSENENLKKQINDRNSDVNAAKRMILSFLGKPAFTEPDQWGDTREVYTKSDLLSLLGELFNYVNK